MRLPADPGEEAIAARLRHIREEIGECACRSGRAPEDIRLLWAGAASTSALLGNYMLRKGMDPRGEMDGLKFFEAYDAGDPAAKEALADLGRMVAAGIYSIQAVLDLERYAIGGGISARQEVTDAVRAGLEEIFTNVKMTPFSKPEVVICRYGNDANLLGALQFHRARQ